MSRRTHARRPLLAATAVATLALVTACASGDAPADDAPATAGTTAPATTAPPAEPTPSTTPTEGDTDPEADAAAPPFPADTSVDTAEPSGDAALTVTDVRAGHHDGFDRVVLELAGTGTPGWRVEYVDAAIEDPTGETVDLAGDSVLQVVVTGAAYPYVTGATEFPLRQPVTAAGTTVVAESVLLGTFEAQSQALIGVTGAPAPFRAYLLENPTRVVVDVQG